MRLTRIAMALGVVGMMVVATAGAAGDDTKITVKGMVVDRAGEPVAGASVSVRGEGLAASGPDGAFELRLEKGPATISISHPAYRAVRRELVVDTEIPGLHFVLSPVLSVTDSITVTAIRAGDEAPMTVKNLSSSELERKGLSLICITCVND